MRFPDVEAMVRTFLASKVTPSVATRVPNPRPATFVRVWRTGGGASNRVVERAQVTVTAWAVNAVDAFALAGKCRDALLQDYVSMTFVRGVEEVSGPYYDPDPETGIARYTFTHRLLVRAERN